jgi:hypothetical protein
MTVRGVVGVNAMLAAARTTMQVGTQVGAQQRSRTPRADMRGRGRGGAGCLDGTHGSGWRPWLPWRSLWRTPVLQDTTARRE